jgi:hypothetical protein
MTGYALLFLWILTGQSGAPSSPLTQKGNAREVAGEVNNGAGPDVSEQLLKVRRIYVDTFGDDKISQTLQAMTITSLTGSKRFIVTENREKADAVLRGSALEKTSHELHAKGEGTAVATAAGAHSGELSGSWSAGSGQIAGSHRGAFGAESLATEDSVATTETIDDARIAVRLVSKDGDVIWSTTQESQGAKYKGASADVADKIVKQLVRDIEKLEQKSTGRAKE